MKIIGITGGVGAGKSKLLEYIHNNYNARIIFSDDAAKETEKKGMPCYDALVSLLGDGILSPDGEIDKKLMASRIFGDDKLLAKVNGIIHPEVKLYIKAEIEKERVLGEKEFFFIEAALLIEDHYDEICDELWYIYADEKVRRERLKASRNYSDEKTDSIMAAQLSEAEFRKGCKRVIDNSGDVEEAYRQIDLFLQGD